MKLFRTPIGTLSIIVASLLSSSVSAKTQVIHAGELLAVPGQKPLSKQTLVIKDGKITAIKGGFVTKDKIAHDAELIDLKDSFVMPGLFDMHVHLQGQFGPKNDSESLRMSDADRLVISANYARKTLMAGFTTVRDLGGLSEQSFALRDGIKKGYLDGPNIIAAG